MELVMVLLAGMLSTSRIDRWVLRVAVAVKAKIVLLGTFSLISVPSRKYADLETQQQWHSFQGGGSLA